MALFDPGLQAERTELAWRRTSLALGVGSLVALRLLPAAFGSLWWILPGIAGLVAATAMWLHSRRRMNVVQRRLRHQGTVQMPGARGLAGLALFVAVTGVLALAVVLFGPAQVRLW